MRFCAFFGLLIITAYSHSAEVAPKKNVSNDIESRASKMINVPYPNCPISRLIGEPSQDISSFELKLQLTKNKLNITEDFKRAQIFLGYIKKLLASTLTDNSPCLMKKGQEIPKDGISKPDKKILEETFINLAIASENYDLLDFMDKASQSEKNISNELNKLKGIKNIENIIRKIEEILKAYWENDNYNFEENTLPHHLKVYVDTDICTSNIIDIPPKSTSETNKAQSPSPVNKVLSSTISKRTPTEPSPKKKEKSPTRTRDNGPMQTGPKFKIGEPVKSIFAPERELENEIQTTSTNRTTHETPKAHKPNDKIRSFPFRTNPNTIILPTGESHSKITYGHKSILYK